MMSRIEYPDFDIFELDELMSEKASVLIANEILKRVDFVRSGMIDSYSRTNALYHNDLHNLNAIIGSNKNHKPLVKLVDIGGLCQSSK